MYRIFTFLKVSIRHAWSDMMALMRTEQKSALTSAESLSGLGYLFCVHFKTKHIAHGLLIQHLFGGRAGWGVSLTCNPFIFRVILASCLLKRLNFSLFLSRVHTKNVNGNIRTHSCISSEVNIWAPLCLAPIRYETAHFVMLVFNVHR